MNDARIALLAALYRFLNDIQWEVKPLNKLLVRVRECTPNFHHETLCGLLNFIAEYRTSTIR